MQVRNRQSGAMCNWVYTQKPSANDVDILCREFGRLHRVVAALMVARGLKERDDIARYFSTDLKNLKTAGKLLGRDIAANRILKAIGKGEKIRLYGDYDVDGTSSVAMMSIFLRNMGADFDHYIPDRYHEGYGLSEEGVRLAVRDEVDLLITLDCGIRAVERIESLKSAGIDTIVCDHHEPGPQLPPAFAILNPKQKACTYAGKELCGCGVGLVLILEMLENSGQTMNLNPFYELAAIATCSDIVPLIGVNRSIVAKGLEVLSTSPSYGVKAVLEAAGHKTRAVNVSDIVFKIAPRINAAGRMEHADLGVKLLTAKTAEDAKHWASELEKANVSRKDLDKSITEEALEMMLEEDPEAKRYTTVLNNEGWHKGLVGIVASRLMERVYRPTVVLTETDGLLTGSARSLEGFNLHENLTQCDELLERYGGHAAAAGLTLKKENLPEFKERFESLASQQILSKERRPRLDIDLMVDFAEWHNEDYLDFYNQINRFRPYGPSNLPPVFATSNCLADRVAVAGKEHLRFEVFQPGNPNRLPAIAFRQAAKYDELASGSSFEIAYTIDENNWKGSRKLQLVVKDIKTT